MPLEIMTMLISTVLSAVLSMMAQKNKTQAAEKASMIAALNAQADVVQVAREHGLKDARFAVTRQIIALTAVFSILVLPKVYPILMLWLEQPHYTMYYGYTEYVGGWLPWTGKDIVIWKETFGVAITPLDTHMVSAIVGYYFGSQMTKS